MLLPSLDLVAPNLFILEVSPICVTFFLLVAASWMGLISGCSIWPITDLLELSILPCPTSPAPPPH